jgi:DNA invertase Pin-like site-specific DNA recombinase
LIFKKRSFFGDPGREDQTPPDPLQKLLQKPVCSTTSLLPFSETISGMIDDHPAALEPPGAEPAVLTGIKIGYARVSTGGQHLERQTDALGAAGCRRIFAEKKSGRDTGRPELAACLEFMQPGDTLVVPSLDRLSRSLQDLITTVGDLRRRGVGFTSLHESLDTTTPGGRLVFHVFAALAEFIRELIAAGTREGLAAARARGRVGGRPTVITPQILTAARDMLPNPRHSITSIAALLGVSPALFTTTSRNSARSAGPAERAPPCRSIPASPPRWRFTTSYCRHAVKDDHDRSLALAGALARQVVIPLPLSAPEALPNSNSGTRIPSRLGNLSEI